MLRLLQLTLSGSAMALLLLLLRRALGKRLPSTVVYYAWLLVLLRFLLPLPGLVPVPTAGGAQSDALPQRERPGLWNEELPEPSIEDALPLETADGVPVLKLPTAEASPAGEVPAAASAGEDPASRAGQRPAALWRGVWAVGAGLSFLFFALSYLIFTAQLRRSLRRPDALARAVYDAIDGRKPTLWRSARVRTPLTYGLLAPKIVLPAERYDERELQNIFRHELTHVRRCDALYKWFVAAVVSLHWFNPLTYVIRREIDRVCELSCDETLLRTMDRAGKQAYGETLLSMAASGALPAGVVATTFATEKKNLKERLEQIMYYRKSGARVLAAVLALLLLVGCGAAAGPLSELPVSGEDEGFAVPGADNAVKVSSVDELLAAIAPDTAIELADGIYELDAAANYGGASGSAYYEWAPVFDGFELKIHDVENLSIFGSGAGRVTLSAAPRYANVAAFASCRGVTVAGLTAGHTREPGYCAGGVLRFDACSDCAVRRCGLYGCGIIGVWGVDSTALTVDGCDIYECSNGAVSLSACRSVTVTGCDVHDCGTKPGQGDAMYLFDADNCDSVRITGCSVHDNAAQTLLSSSYSKSVCFLSNEVTDNRFAGVFALHRFAPTVDGCRFRNKQQEWYLYSEGVFVRDLDGQALTAGALEEMTYREIDPETVVPAPAPTPGTEVAPGAEIAVRTVDEFLAAIGPERTVVLDGELFDLSTASDYGAAGGKYYFWHTVPDGPELIIKGVKGLTIKAASDDAKAVTVAAIPRYANVLSFKNCDDVSLIGFTAGHTKEPGECSGGVLYFENCNGIGVDACRLYGCGILGVQTQHCTSFKARDCEIYECSQGAASMNYTDGAAFLNCDVHDVPNPALRFFNSADKSWDGEALTDDAYDLKDGALTPAHAEGEINIMGMSIMTLDATGRDLADGRQLRYPFPEGGRELAFAQTVQQLIADGDWEKLADHMSFPLMIFTDGANYSVSSREEFLSSELDAVLTESFRQRVAAASLDDIGLNLLGNTCADDCIVFAHNGGEGDADVIQVMALIVRG